MKHNSNTLKKIVRGLKQKGFTFIPKKKGYLIKPPVEIGGSGYLVHFKESAIHPMRRFFKSNYGITIM
jgi:hypothetical protein